MHRNFANRSEATADERIPSYYFKFPPKQNVIDALNLSNKMKRQQNSLGHGHQIFIGNNPILTEESVETAIWKFSQEQSLES